MRVQHMTPPLLTIGANLFLRGNEVISYETVVGEIKDNVLVEHAKFSRTTSKHICKVATILGIRVDAAKEKDRDFYKHEYGVKFNHNNQLSSRFSHAIIEMMRKGKTQFEAMVTCSPSTKKDRDILEEYLESVGFSRESKEISETFGLVIY